MDWTSLIASIVVALAGLIGSAIGSYSGFKITAYRVGQLEKKVDEHNNFARRMPLVEKDIEVIQCDIKSLKTKL